MINEARYFFSIKKPSNFLSGGSFFTKFEIFTNLMSFTQEQRSLFKRNIEFYLSNLPNNLHQKNTLDFTIKITNLLEIKGLAVNNLSEDITAKIQAEINQGIGKILQDLLFYNPDEFELSLKDYIEYLIEKRGK